MKKKGRCGKGRVAPKTRRVRDSERCPTSARLHSDPCLRQRLQRGSSPSPPCPAFSPPGILGPLELTWHPWVLKAHALNPPPLVGFWGRTGSGDDGEGACMCSSSPFPSSWILWKKRDTHLVPAQQLQTLEEKDAWRMPLSSARSSGELPHSSEAPPHRRAALPPSPCTLLRSALRI